MFQEVVGNLVTHIGSGSAGEVEGSLDILARLIETDVQKMAPFAVFVKVCLSTIHVTQNIGTLIKVLKQNHFSCLCN